VSFDGLDELLTGNDLDWGDVVAAAALLAVGFAISYVIGVWRRRLLGRPGSQSAQLISLLARVGQVLVIAVFAGWALTRLGSDIGFLTVVVLVALFIGVLALRPILEGIGASAALTTRPAFGIGDEISVGDIAGEVIEITNRSTVIRLRDARLVHIPNVEMINKTVTVITIDGERRSSVDVTLGFDTDIDHAETVLRDALGGLDEISRVGSIRARGLRTGVEISIRFWHPSSIQAGNDAIDAAVRTIKRTLQREGITLAPPIEIDIVNEPHAPPRA
jgi:small-conductance mechanosensitive channel